MSSFVSPCPSLFSSFFLCPLFLSCFASLLRNPCSRVSFSRSRRRTDVSRSSSLSLFLSVLSLLFLFVLNYVTANLRRVFAVSLALFLLRFSQWSRYVSPSSFFPWSLLLASYANCSRGEPERARNSPLFSRLGVPATEQISNKWDGCAKPRRFNYWCLVAAHRESRATASASLRSCRWYSSFLPSASLLLPRKALTAADALTVFSLPFSLNAVVMPS